MTKDRKLKMMGVRYIKSAKYDMDGYYRCYHRLIKSTGKYTKTPSYYEEVLE